MRNIHPYIIKNEEVQPLGYDVGAVTCLPCLGESAHAWRRLSLTGAQPPLHFPPQGSFEPCSLLKSHVHNGLKIEVHE